MPVDSKIIKRKINLISRDLKSLKKISIIPLAKYLDSAEYEALAERYLERMVGRMIDINYHILSAEDIMPADYYTSFIEMGKQKYLPVKLADSLANFAGLRNRLAHEYDEIDQEQVYRAAGRAIKEVPLYLEAVLKILEKTDNQKRLI